MLANILLGLLTRVACPMVQAILVVIAVTFYLRNLQLVGTPTLVGTARRATRGNSGRTAQSNTFSERSPSVIRALAK